MEINVFLSSTARMRTCWIPKDAHKRCFVSWTFLPRWPADANLTIDLLLTVLREIIDQVWKKLFFKVWIVFLHCEHKGNDWREPSFSWTFVSTFLFFFGGWESSSRFSLANGQHCFWDCNNIYSISWVFVHSYLWQGFLKRWAMYLQKVVSFNWNLRDSVKCNSISWGSSWIDFDQCSFTGKSIINLALCIWSHCISLHAIALHRKPLASELCLLQQPLYKYLTFQVFVISP